MIYFPATILTICHNTEKQSFCNRFLHDFDYSHIISLMVGQEGQSRTYFGKWLAIWQFCTENGQRPVVIFKSVRGGWQVCVQTVATKVLRSCDTKWLP